MRNSLALLFAISLLGCSANSRNKELNSQPAPSPSNETASQKSNSNSPAACSLITSAEIAAVQGEPYKDTQGNEHVSGGLSVSHCVYVLPTYSKSVSLDVTRNDSSASSQDGVKKFWESRFHQASRTEEDREKEEAAEERDKDKAGRREREEEEEGGVKPQPISRLGEEAFWVGSSRKGALYILKNNAVVIVSIGGAETESEKIKKTTDLAQQVLKRL